MIDFVADTETERFENVPLESISPSKLNRRTIDDESKSMKELTASVKTQGIIQPIILRPVDGHYEIVAGHRRFRASQLAGCTDIKAVIRNLGDEDTAIERVLENFQREDLTCFEEAQSIQDLIDLGMTHDAVADKLGVSVKKVQRRVALLRLTPAWKKAIQSSKSGFANWTPQHFIQIARLPETFQEEILEELDYRGNNKFHQEYNARELEEYINSFFRYIQNAPWKLDDDTLVVDEGCKGVTCELCEDRTDRQPGLWEEDNDSKKGPRCLKLQCWNEKRKAFLCRKQKTLQEKNKKVIPIVTGYGPDDSFQNKFWDERKETQEWEITKCKKNDKGAVPCMIVTGNKAGQVFYGKERTNSKPSNGSSSKDTIKLKVEKWNRTRLRLVIKKVTGRLNIWAEDQEDGPALDQVDILSLVWAFGIERQAQNLNWSTYEPFKDFDECKHWPLEKGILNALRNSCFAVIAKRFNYISQFEYPEMEEIENLCAVLDIDYAKLCSEAQAEMPYPKDWGVDDNGKPVEKANKAKGIKALKKDIRNKK